MTDPIAEILTNLRLNPPPPLPALNNVWEWDDITGAPIFQDPDNVWSRFLPSTLRNSKFVRDNLVGQKFVRRMQRNIQTFSVDCGSWDRTRSFLRFILIQDVNKIRLTRAGNAVTVTKTNVPLVPFDLIYPLQILTTGGKSVDEVIRAQDESIAGCKGEITELKNANIEYKGKLEEMFTKVNQLQTQLTLAQAHQETFEIQRTGISTEDHNAAISQKDYLIQQLQFRIHELEQSFNSSAKNPIQEELIMKLEEENKLLVEELDKMKKDQEELFELLTEQDNQISNLKALLKQNGIPVENDHDDIFDEHATSGPDAEENPLQ